MKQHITVDQLNELNVSQRINLTNFYNKKNEFIVWGDRIFTNGRRIHINFQTYPEFDNPNIKDTVLTDPLLSIGQMIEFLDENDFDWLNELYCVARGDTPFPYIRIGYGFQELCDALWKAVKEVLNK